MKDRSGVESGEATVELIAKRNRAMSKLNVGASSRSLKGGRGSRMKSEKSSLNNLSLHPLRLTKLFLCFVAFVLAPFAPTPARAQRNTEARLRPQHRAVVESFLARPRFAEFRLATDGDGYDPVMLRHARRELGRRFDPIYAVGDFNRDGQEDFAVILRRVNAGNGSMALAVFNGPFRRGRPVREAFFSADFQSGDMLFRRRMGLLIGPYQSDNCYTLRSRGTTYRLEECLTGDPSS